MRDLRVFLIRLREDLLRAWAWSAREAVEIWHDTSRRKRALIVAAGVAAALFLILFSSLWRAVDERLKKGMLAGTYNLYSAPKTLEPGQTMDAARLTAYLDKAGYSAAAANPVGYYVTAGDSVEVHPGRDSYFQPEAARVVFSSGKIKELRALSGGGAVDRYALEPVLISNLTSGEERERRHPVTAAELPKVFVDALLAAEDKRFFEHFGFDSLRILKASFVNLKSGRKEQGGSTLTMQLARNLWLDQEKTWARKGQEFLIALILELKLSKKEILEYYCNQVYLGRRETFNIQGFGAAARVFFSKDLQDVTLAEAALLAGNVQRPSYTDPVRHADRALARRNSILQMMHRNGAITEAQLKAASDSPLNISPLVMDDSEAPYFMDTLAQQLKQRQAGRSLEGAPYRVYTTVDVDLQMAASEAVQTGIVQVDKTLAQAGRFKADATRPQVAMVVLDAYTGEVRAAVGGRSYGVSQLNRVLARRQPGSVFKPFVYTAALESQLDPHARHFTGATMLLDLPTQFKFGDEDYEPGNFGEEYHGWVTMRSALVSSMNIATVSLAEKVGYRKVVDVAKRAGLNDQIRATPSVALGSYECTPLEIAGAYTIFANDGEYLEPTLYSSIRASDGRLVAKTAPTRRQALDPRVAFLIRNMMEDVINYGTAARVRGSGFYYPAAGKTGTSRDGWFAGFTSGLICVVWVGFDDNRELEIEGGRSALLLWVEFMKRAVRLGDYAGNFSGIPAGLGSANICAESGMQATPECPRKRGEYFILGSGPGETCDLHGDNGPSVVPVSNQ